MHNTHTTNAAFVTPSQEEVDFQKLFTPMAAFAGLTGAIDKRRFDELVEEFEAWLNDAFSSYGCTGDVEGILEAVAQGPNQQGKAHRLTITVESDGDFDSEWYAMKAFGFDVETKLAEWHGTAGRAVWEEIVGVLENLNLPTGY